MSRLATDSGQAAGSALRCFYEGTVTDEEIDELGHMNVRCYATRALHASRALAAFHGLGPELCAELGAEICVTDAFTRHYREQLVGSHLAVRSGVLAGREHSLRLYHELFNVERHELGATFVHEVQLQGSRARETRPLPEFVMASAGKARVAWPDHGKPRSLDLDRAPVRLKLETAVQRRLEMRLPRTIGAEECDADGFFSAPRFEELIWGGQLLNGRPAGMPLFESDSGRKFGWATLESRSILFVLPRVGSRIQSFSALVEIARKTWHGHHWVFDLDHGTLLARKSIVNLAFDIGARRSSEIPPRIRSSLEAAYHPDLA